jgi:L-cysteine desulfidase
LTEPIAVAYAASLAGELLGPDITDVEITVDPGVYKNGFAVTIPNTGGEHGNLIAGVLGALVQQPQLKMEILKRATPELVTQAKKVIADNKAHLYCDRSQNDLFIDVQLRSGDFSARAVIQGSHTNLIQLTHNNHDLLKTKADAGKPTQTDFKKILKQTTIGELVDLAEQMDEDDYRYIQRGIEMNLRISAEGRKLAR